MVLNKYQLHLKFLVTLTESHEGFCSKKYQVHIPCSFAYKLVCVDYKFSKPIVLYRGKNAAYKFVEAILEEYEYCQKVMKKHLKKNLVMTEEEGKQFQSSNVCWICEKFIKDDNGKVRDHCHITEKFRGTIHWNCNISLRLTKKFL